MKPGGKGGVGRLALTRGVGESVEIVAGDERITVMVVRLVGTGSVRLLFIAPRGVAIDRSEVARRKVPA